MKWYILCLVFTIAYSAPKPWSIDKMTLKKLLELQATFDMGQPENSKLLALCEDFPNWSESLKRGNPPEATILVDKANAACDVLRYVSIGFKSCANKLNPDSAKSCFQDWNPFPKVIKSDKDKTEKVPLEACKNFLGKDNCVEKEITEGCGVETWDEFKKNFQKFNKLTGACDLE